MLILRKVGYHGYCLGGGVKTQGSEVVHEIQHGINGQVLDFISARTASPCVRHVDKVFFLADFLANFLAEVDVADMERVFLFMCVL